MQRSFATTVIFCAAILSIADATYAQNPPWCAIMDNDGTTQCNFYTQQQCLADDKRRWRRMHPQSCGKRAKLRATTTTFCAVFGKFAGVAATPVAGSRTTAGARCNAAAAQ